ncbi:YcgL domain-containing protein [Balneatrix alpica]|uniref:YcgL domain-containing protein ACFFLH_00200 n=1 Tax=Balneatrix alpica TaxID=75684 RepID=A0ABV5Z9F4_9GAMM|nr:YcgL domain-containing protein [Balneatrix alpica]
MKPLLCSIFKSSRKDETYLYVSKPEKLSRVPEALLEQFGKPVHVMDMLLKPDRQLARAKGEDVINRIMQQGFYLQLPPPREEYMLDLYKAPTEGRY